MKWRVVWWNMKDYNTEYWQGVCVHDASMWNFFFKHGRKLRTLVPKWKSASCFIDLTNESAEDDLLETLWSIVRVHIWSERSSSFKKVITSPVCKLTLLVTKATTLTYDLVVLTRVKTGTPSFETKNWYVTGCLVWFLWYIYIHNIDHADDRSW